MPLPSNLTLSFTTIKRIKMAVGCQCELCGQESPLILLEIHYIPGSSSMKKDVKVKELQRELLVLCPTCHHDIHSYPVTRADQKD
jgi:transcription elongation factor Elf1